jgi:transketolase
MGISKARGIAWAKRHLGRGGRVVVMTGDGELQEGQNWEALQAAAHQRVGGLLVVVDRNELQSDKTTEEILALESLEAKVTAFGARVVTCDGHDHAALRDAFRTLWRGDDGTPGVLVARTIKGKGVSFMEHPAALQAGGGLYRWHAGAPDDATFAAAAGELRARLDESFAQLGLAPLVTEEAPPLDDTRTSLQGEPESGAGAPAPRPVVTRREAAEYVAAAYGEALLELAAREPRLVVLDADLASDCRVRAFELAEPGRFVENGIAEQDMVSMAAGMARHGLLPVVNSFASFLASRANEQIYNQASERTKVVYAMHYAGLIPAGPGKSHQSLRDASLMAAIPGVTVVHPCNAGETRAVVEWAVLEAPESVAIRVAIGPSPRRIELPAGYVPAPGVGVTLRDGGDTTIVSYGPVMLHEALTAAELLEGRGIDAAVVAMPWLDRVEPDWLAETFAGVRDVLVVEDHAPVGALGDTLRRAVAALPEPPAIQVAGVEGWPACGTPTEALRHHALDGASLAERVALALPGRTGT